MKLIQKVISENPFYNNKDFMAMLNSLPKAYSKDILDRAWKSCKTIEDKELFFSLFFAVGDITNRDHNIFSRTYTKEFKADNGGHAQRAIFRQMLNWLIATEPKAFYRMLPLIPEYSVIENLFYYQLRTDRFKGTVKSVERINVDIDKIAKYIGFLIREEKLSQAEEILWQKFLTHPRLRTRQRRNKDHKIVGRRALKPETIKRQEFKFSLLAAISNEVGWEIIKYPNHVEFKGFNDWKKKYDEDILNLTESKMFATHKIKQLDKAMFFKWLDRQPSGANYRIRRRLMDKDDKDKGKWKSNYGFSFANAFKEWEKYKVENQKEARVLEAKVKLGTATEKEVKKLEKVKKEAKVNVGGDTLYKCVCDLLKGNLTQTEADLKIHSMLEKTKFEVPCLIISDQSGSMGSDGGLPLKIARLLTTVALIKNPDPELGNMFLRFGTSCEVVTGRLKGEQKKNRFMAATTTYVDELIVPEKTFIENLHTISQLISNTQGGTRIDTVAQALKIWTEQDPQYKAERIEIISKYPVFVIVSDGEFNNSYSAAQSLNKFKNDMLQWFGWTGAVVVWDVSRKENQGNEKADKFEGCDNVLHFSGFNIGIINTIFSNIHDIDIIDIYAPLLSMYRSNRYQPVREYVQKVYGKVKPESVEEQV